MSLWLPPLERMIADLLTIKETTRQFIKSFGRHGCIIFSCKMLDTSRDLALEPKYLLNLKIPRRQDEYMHAIDLFHVPQYHTDPHIMILRICMARCIVQGISRARVHAEGGRTFSMD